ncbi:hypothetical protein WJ565_003176 [Vibrio parahaemolyticus]|nr:hypothetical protein [Vibrio parahaemolyticus]EGR2885284.1 hypothetical protein [Vibrio parahaemolyticus]EGR2977848.1 hypothetical protein [Vibrio parahaemolyticus]EGR3012956.1 hypothetical protein [Vibrio parahaemolyticus]EJC6741178.1 hypothetical protein [Vibrio parahaemolyticus]
MNKTLKIILVLSMFIMIQIVGSLEQINSEAANYQFEPAGNGISQVLFFKLYTIPGLCIVTINNGKPINAKYSSST